MKINIFTKINLDSHKCLETENHRILNIYNVKRNADYDFNKYQNKDCRLVLNSIVINKYLNKDLNFINSIDCIIYTIINSVNFDLTGLDLLNHYTKKLNKNNYKIENIFPVFSKESKGNIYSKIISKLFYIYFTSNNISLALLEEFIMHSHLKDESYIKPYYVYLKLLIKNMMKPLN